jgi:hypothetical protein
LKIKSSQFFPLEVHIFVAKKSYQIVCFGKRSKRGKYDRGHHPQEKKKKDHRIYRADYRHDRSFDLCIYGYHGRNRRVDMKKIEMEREMNDLKIKLMTLTFVCSSIDEVAPEKKREILDRAAMKARKCLSEETVDEQLKTWSKK